MSRAECPLEHKAIVKCLYSVSMTMTVQQAVAYSITLRRLTLNMVGGL
jgi:hypothetical protein